MSDAARYLKRYISAMGLRVFNTSMVLLLPALVLGPGPAPALAFPPGGAGGGQGAPAGSPHGAVPPAPPSAPAAGGEAVWMRLDGVPYLRKDVSDYARHVLGKPSEDDAELGTHCDDLAVDLLAYDDAVSEVPGLPEDPHVKAALRKIRGVLLPGLLYDAEIREKVSPTRAEILARLPDPKEKLELSVIVSEDQKAIWEADERIAAGEPFPEVARKVSAGFGAEKGGRIGAVEAGKYDMFTPEEFQRIGALADGKTTAPFRSRIGWMIVRLDKRWSPAELKALDVDQNLESYVAADRGEAFKALVDGLFAKARIAWREPVVEAVRAAVRKDGCVTGDLLTKEIVDVDGEPIYVLEIGDLSRFHSAESLDLYLDKAVRNTVLAHEAQRLGLDRGYEKVLETGRKRAVTRRFFELKSLGMGATDQEIRAFFDENPEKFMYEEARRLLVIETATRAEAEKALKEARRKGADFRKLAAKVNREPSQKKSGGDAGFLLRRQLHPDVGGAVFAAAEGDVLGPFEVSRPGSGTAFAVVKVIAVRKPAPIPFDKCNRELIADKITSGKMARFYEEFLRKIEKDHRVEMLFNKGVKGEGRDAARL